jgi:phage I-like protein
MLPAGPEITGRSGVGYKSTNPQIIVDSFAQFDQDLPLDFEHSTEHKAPKGEPAPAAGWIIELEVRDGEIWARVDWNEAGRHAVEQREYRYISPVFHYGKDTREVFLLTSAALTNRPELRLKALNRAGEPRSQKESPIMDEEICKALGLDATASKDDILKAINSAAKAATNVTPSLDQFVPRDDFDKAICRATDAETKLKANAQAVLDGQITTEIDAALKAGKITPATVEYHKASCSQSGGLDRFRDFVKASPEIAADNASPSNSPEQKAGTLGDEQKAVCRAMGISEEDYLKTISIENKEAA